MSSTAKGAGNTLRINLTTTCQHEVRTQELIKSQRRPIDLGLAGRSDESASARRKFKDLTGPTGIYCTFRDIRDGRVKCWRDYISEKKQLCFLRRL